MGWILKDLDDNAELFVRGDLSGLHVEKFFDGEPRKIKIEIPKEILLDLFIGFAREELARRYEDKVSKITSLDDLLDEVIGE